MIVNLFFFSLTVCPGLTIPNSALIEYEAADVKDVMTVSCANFYELQGESVLTCTTVSSTEAEWSSEAPVCTQGNF